MARECAVSDSPESLRGCLRYLSNTGLGGPGRPPRLSLPIDAFDDDHAPIGPLLRRDLRDAGWIIETPEKQIVLAQEIPEELRRKERSA